jgi:hypothetical protein
MLRGAFFSAEISSLSEELKMRIQNRMNNHSQIKDIEDALCNEGE